ncbi:MAG: hypothetical protein AB8I08_18000 [Sandaracinaceae bacterium]
MSRAEQAARLAHDVGKYVARIARNVPAGAPVPAPLLPLLVKDLYERPGADFASLSAGLEHPDVAVARAHLGRLDALESAVREGQPDACVEACGLALQIEAALARCAEAMAT